MNNNNILYIGLNGYAGSGKDTVAKILYCLLNYKIWDSKEEAYDFYMNNFATHIKPYATLKNNKEDNYCTCIAFADRLKEVCSTLFGIPLKYFYYNKSNSWICINKDFEYTENKPQDSYIVTAEDYFYGTDKYVNSSDRYYMSLREILVYVGTYMCQYHISRNVFVNSVRNTIKQIINKENTDLSYVICTDVRFLHEFDFVKDNKGIMINIVRDDIVQDKNIAEHELDILDESDYDYIIENNSSYKDLFDNIWDLVHTEDIFKNITIDIPSSMNNNINTYVRKLNTDGNSIVYELVPSVPIVFVRYESGNIISIKTQNGPTICIGDIIDNIKLESIKFDCNKNTYLLYGHNETA